MAERMEISLNPDQVRDVGSEIVQLGYLVTPRDFNLRERVTQLLQDPTGILRSLQPRVRLPELRRRESLVSRAGELAAE